MKKILFAALALAVVAGSGFGGWYFLNQSGESYPTLDAGGAMYQGKSVESQFGYLEYDEFDAAENDVSQRGNLKESKQGIVPFYVSVDAPLQDIMENFQPENGLKVLFAYYSGGYSNLSKGFHTYPVGPFETTEITNLNTFMVKANSVFFLSTSDDFEYNSDMIKDTTKPSSNFEILLPNDEKGWVLTPLSSADDLKDPRIDLAFIYSKEGKFEKVRNLDNADLNGGYIAWLRVKEGPPLPTLYEECGNGILEADEECDDSNTNNGDGCDASCLNEDSDVCANIEGIQTVPPEGMMDIGGDCLPVIIPPVCGDGNVDAALSEECDDGNTTDGDGCDADCTTTPDEIAVCGDGTLDTTSGEQCDDGNTTDGDGCDSTCNTEAIIGNANLNVITTLAPINIGIYQPVVPPAGTPAHIESIKYITNNIVVDSPIFKNLTFQEAAQLDERYKSDLYTSDNMKNDDLTAPYIVSAIEVVVAGDEGTVDLASLAFDAEGKKIRKKRVGGWQNWSDASTLNNFCFGITNYIKLLSYSDAAGLSQSAPISVGEDMTFDAGEINNQFNLSPGSYIIILEFHNLDRCTKPPTHLYPLQGRARFQADITNISFSQSDGIEIYSGNSKNQESANIINTELSREIWLNDTTPKD